MKRSAALLSIGLAMLGCDSSDDQPTAAATSTGAGGEGGSGGSGPSGELAASMRHLSYRFDLESAQTSSELTLDVAEPGGDCTSIACDLVLESASWQQQPATQATLEGGKLHACGAPVAGGETLVLGAETTVPEQTFLGLDVGFSRLPSLGGGTFSYLLSWVGGCDRFGPCDDDPSLLASFDIEVSHPAGTLVLCPGAREAQETLTRCRIDDSGALAPTYSAFAIAADPSWQESIFLTAAGVTLTFYEAPGGGLQSSLDAGRVQAFLEWITSLLGPYPYGSELRIAAGPTAWLGFEHPANIVLREDLDQLPTAYSDTLMHVFMHEVAHQWAGDRTTLASALDFVWKEAIAEYLAYVFEDEQGDPGDGGATRAYWDAASQGARYHPRPTDEPAPPVEAFYGDVYGPGPMTLFLQLEPFLGRAVVLEAIAAFLSSATARSVEDLRGALEAASGERLGAYFDAWVFGSGAPSWPQLSAEVTQIGDQVTVTLTQTVGAPHPCRVEVRIDGATSSATALVDFGLAPSGPQASATVTLAEPVTGHVIDPDHRVIDVNASAALPRPKVWIF